MVSFSSNHFKPPGVNLPCLEFCSPLPFFFFFFFSHATSSTHVKVSGERTATKVLIEYRDLIYPECVNHLSRSSLPSSSSSLVNLIFPYFFVLHAELLTSFLCAFKHDLPLPPPCCCPPTPSSDVLHCLNLSRLSPGSVACMMSFLPNLLRFKSTCNSNTVFKSIIVLE